MEMWKRSRNSYPTIFFLAWPVHSVLLNEKTAETAKNSTSTIEAPLNNIDI
jgi:hypothetical protein